MVNTEGQGFKDRMT